MSDHLTRDWPRHGWSTRRSVSTHGFRSWCLQNEFPAWPAALEVMEQILGLRLPISGGRCLDARFSEWPLEDATRPPEGWCPVAWDRGPISVDIIGAVRDASGVEYPSWRDYLSALD